MLCMQFWVWLFETKAYIVKIVIHDVKHDFLSSFLLVIGMISVWYFEQNNELWTLYLQQLSLIFLSKQIAPQSHFGSLENKGYVSQIKCQFCWLILFLRDKVFSCFFSLIFFSVNVFLRSPFSKRSVR